MGLFQRLKGVLKESVSFSTADSQTSVGRKTVNSVKEFFNFIFGSQSTQKYLNAFTENPLVYMVVDKVAKTAASMPRIIKDDNGVELDDSVIMKSIGSVNTNLIEFYNEAGQSLLLSGNIYILYIDDNFGLQPYTKVLKPGCVEPVLSSNSIQTGWKYINEYGKTDYYDLEEILHVKTSNIITNDRNDHMLGISPLKAAWVVVQSSNEKFNAEASIFKNRGIAGIMTSKGDVPMKPSERTRMQDAFDKRVGGSDKFNKLMLSETELQYIQTGMSPTDLKLLEGILSSLRIIASIYGMPSVLFNDNDNSTYNNFSTAVEIAYSDVYLPLANHIDSKLSKFLSEKLSVSEHIEVDVNRIDQIKKSTHPISQAIANYDGKVASLIVGAMSKDEARDTLGLDPITGGDDFLTPVAEPKTEPNE